VITANHMEGPTVRTGPRGAPTRCSGRPAGIHVG
jgi:hypothetical protein